MKQRNTNDIIGICYDFDGTLAHGNMQEYGLIQKLGMTTEEFWTYTANFTIHHQADPILSYMKTLIDIAKSKNITHVLCKNNIQECGKNISYFKGVENWFDNINAAAAIYNVDIEHYVISSGMSEILEGTSIASKFTDIYGCSYIYGDDGVPMWPGQIVNYTMKTQYLYRISKGATDLLDSVEVNKHMPSEKHRIPFKDMVYIGDGLTDVPCMKIVKENGGLSIAVFDPDKLYKAKTISNRLKREGRVQLACEADYSENGAIFAKTINFIRNRAYEKYCNECRIKNKKVLNINLWENMIQEKHYALYNVSQEEEYVTR